LQALVGIGKLDGALGHALFQFLAQRLRLRFGLLARVRVGRRSISGM